MGSSKLSRTADDKKDQKELFGSLPWCDWCQAGEPCTQEGFIALPWLFPHGRSERLSSASGATPTLFTSGTQSTAGACAGWMGSNLPDLSTVRFSLHTFSSQLFGYLPYKKLRTGSPRIYNASSGPKYLKYPVKHSLLLVLKDLFSPTTFQNNKFWFQIRMNLLLKLYTQKC